MMTSNVSWTFQKVFGSSRHHIKMMAMSSSSPSAFRAPRPSFAASVLSPTMLVIGLHLVLSYVIIDSASALLLAIGPAPPRRNKISMLMTDSHQQELGDGILRSTNVVEHQQVPIQRKRYTHDGLSLTYRYLPAAAGDDENESSSPSSSYCLLIHPVGIGLSSWYWEEMMLEWQSSSSHQARKGDGDVPLPSPNMDLYAPDLIGCGIHHDDGGDAWDPDQRGLFFPLDWVRGCETLLQTIATTSTTTTSTTSATTSSTKKSNQWSFPSLFGQSPSISRTTNNNSPPRQTCTVITQGGLAPVGIMLAARNPTLVSKLVLSSPPTWKDMTTPIPQAELQRNYDFLRNPLWGKAAFEALETKWAIEFFSNTFLFANRCNDKWLERAMSELDPLARPPIQAFNAGFLNHRSYEEEMTTLVQQPTLILSGHDDEQRRLLREPYQEFMQNCQLQTLPGKNVLAWESPKEFVQAVSKFVQSTPSMSSS